MENTTQDENAKQLEVIQAVRNFNPEFLKSCYSVGLWVWAEFSERLSFEEVEFLKSLGFRWNPVRKLWQNACGVKTQRSKSDPRLRYPIVKFSED
jgi:hypothetical protein